MVKILMNMKGNIIFVSILMFLSVSCEKVWEADLREKALDTIRGYYQVESGIWEGPDPIDLDGDGVASYDYYDEWKKVLAGAGDTGAVISDDGGYIEIPYIKYSVHSSGLPPTLTRSVKKVRADIDVTIGGSEAELCFRFPDDSDVVFEHTAYGKFTVRTTVTCTIMSSAGESVEITGPVTLRYERFKYKAE